MRYYTTSNGGLSSYITGGDPLQGAVQGLVVYFANHLSHKQTNYLDEDGGLLMKKEDGLNKNITVPREFEELFNLEKSTSSNKDCLPYNNELVRKIKNITGIIIDKYENQIKQNGKEIAENLKKLDIKLKTYITDGSDPKGGMGIVKFINNIYHLNLLKSLKDENFLLNLRIITLKKLQN